MDKIKSDIKNEMLDTWLDDAAGEALSANAPAQSAVYTRELASASPAQRRTDKDLRETVAMLAAASPYMHPPQDLRGKILQATAPASFRMEDYRKLNRETNRFYRWGFYAAMLCLMAGAWYNLSLKNSLSASENNLQAATRQAGERNVALEAILNPNADQITFRQDGKVDGKIIGKAFIDKKTMTAVVILPPGMVPAGKLPQLSMPGEGGPVTYKTVLVTAPANVLEAPAGKSLDSMLAIKDLSPDPHQPRIAGK